MVKLSSRITKAGYRTFAASAMFAIGLMGTFGCKDEKECEKARLETHRAFQTLSQVATERKLAGVDLAKWTSVENKAELLESAFATRQVTWNSADKARDDVQSNLESIKTDNDVSLEIFKRTAAEAFQLQGALADKCR